MNMPLFCLYNGVTVCWPCDFSSFSMTNKGFLSQGCLLTKGYILQNKNKLTGQSNSIICGCVVALKTNKI